MKFVLQLILCLITSTAHADFQKIKSFLGHEEDVTAIASTSGKIATGSSDKTVILWDANSYKVIKKMVGHSDTVNAAAFSPDGKTLYTGDKAKRVFVWDVGTGTKKDSFKAYNDISDISVSPNGEMIAVAADDETLGVYSPQGKVVKKLKGHKGDVLTVRFSPDGKKIVSGGKDNTVIIWDIATEKIIFALKGHTNDVTAVSFSQNGDYIVSGGRDNLLNVWDVKTGENIQTITEHGGTIRGVIFSNGHLVSVDSKTSIGFAFGVPIKQDIGNQCRILVWDASWKVIQQIVSDCDTNAVTATPSGFGIAGKATSIYNQR